MSRLLPSSEKLGAEGMSLAQGSVYGGWSLFVQKNRFVYAFNYLHLEEFVIESDIEVPSGAVTLEFELEATGEADVVNGKGMPGIGRLFITGESAGELEKVIINVSGDESSSRSPDSGYTEHHEARARMAGGRAS